MIQRGSIVRRKTGNQKPGVVVSILPNPIYPNAKPSARVRFVDRTRIGGNGYHHSTIQLKFLVEVEQAQ